MIHIVGERSALKSMLQTVDEEHPKHRLSNNTSNCTVFTAHALRELEDLMNFTCRSFAVIYLPDLFTQLNRAQFSLQTERERKNENWDILRLLLFVLQLYCDFPDSSLPLVRFPRHNTHISLCAKAFFGYQCEFHAFPWLFFSSLCAKT